MDGKPNNSTDIKSIGYGHICAEGALYFCLHGGDRALADAAFACAHGASAIVTEIELEGVALPQILTDDVRREFALRSAAFYGNPADELTMIGVTGTNGKTTTTHIVKSIVEAAGYRAGLIGTNGVMFESEVTQPTLTTPDPPVLHKILRDMADRGIEIVVMEVSAHALALRKTEGIRFAVGAFTNLTQDHLDFFGTMDNYRAAKERLFTPEHTQTAVVNVDDETGIEIARHTTVPTVTFGCENPSDVFGIDYHATDKGCRFVANIMDDIVGLGYCAPGKFNMSNVLCAAAIAKVLGISTGSIRRGVSSVKRVCGRFETIEQAGKRVVIDYAHTPDGLRKILTAVREITNGRVIAVFGCGGDRDRSKRALMGEVASELSDFAVITSDNPRSEPPLGIIKEIESGFGTGNYMLVEDRREGIRYALGMCREGDTVVIAGKGHENTQETNGRLEHFSDEETVRDLLK